MAKPNVYVFGDAETEQHRLLLQAQLLREQLMAQAPKFVSSLPSRLLDLGCGSGNLSMALHELYLPKDIHPRQVEQATQPDHKYLNDHFFRAMQTGAAIPMWATRRRRRGKRDQPVDHGGAG